LYEKLFIDNHIRRVSQGDIAVGWVGGRESGRHCGKKADKPRRQPCSGRQAEKTHCLRGGSLEDIVKRRLISQGDSLAAGDKPRRLAVIGEGEHAREEKGKETT
jgi:hypothetical protein